ncbi:exonuclease domain-containing protein [Nocardia sp. NPDC059239]|uniref:exonuclease domain-containing protein n=1 Tax=unclassified Nocardia TaxID=2637762 RepID=UPI0036904EDC
MTSWTKLPLACADLETTGVEIGTDRIVTAFIGRIDGADIARRHWVANPGIPISAEATEIHGYTDEYVQKHGHPHAEVVAEVVADLYRVWDEGRIVAVFNGAFDFSMLASHHRGFEIRGPIVDSYVLDREFDKYRKGSRKLSAVAIHYRVSLDNAHDAEGDAVAAARLAWRLPRIYPALAEMTADELMAAQAHWYRERAYSFIDWLRRKGESFTDVPTEWPIYSTKAEAA